MRKSIEQAPTAGEQTQQKTVSDVFRHRSGTGKSYCRARFDVGSERVNAADQVSLPYQMLERFRNILYFILALEGNSSLIWKIPLHFFGLLGYLLVRTS
jgi:hypothetical protein